MKIKADITSEQFVLSLEETRSIVLSLEEADLSLIYYLFPKSKFYDHEEGKKIKSEIPKVDISNNKLLDIFNDYPLLYRDFANLNYNSIGLFLFKYGRLGLNQSSRKHFTKNSVNKISQFSRDINTYLVSSNFLMHKKDLDESLYFIEYESSLNNEIEIMDICINFNNAIKLESNNKDNYIHGYSYDSHSVQIDNLNLADPLDESKPIKYVNEKFSITTNIDNDDHIISRSLIQINDSIFDDDDENYYFYDDENQSLGQENGVDTFGNEKLIHTISYENKNVLFKDYENNQNHFNQELLISYIEKRVNAFELKFNISEISNNNNNYSANFTSNSLLHTLWLQFANEVLNKPKILNCKNFKNCNKKIIINTKKNIEKSLIDFHKLSTKKKIYCSDACRQEIFQKKNMPELDYKDFLDLLRRDIEKTTKLLTDLVTQPKRHSAVMPNHTFDYLLNINKGPLLENGIKYFIEIKHRPPILQTRHINYLVLDVIEQFKEYKAFRKSHPISTNKYNTVIILICAGISDQALKKIRKANPKEDLIIVFSLENNEIVNLFGEDKIINDALNITGEEGDKINYFGKMRQLNNGTIKYE